MDITNREPAATIRAELARRRMTAGRLSAATGIPQTTLQRRLAKPEDFRIAELSAIATVLEVNLEVLTAPYSAGARG